MAATVKSSDEGKLLPPYVAYKTFAAFLEGIKKAGLPSRIDRSVMASLSGTAQSQLASALRLFDLVSENGLPTERLQKLLAADGAEKKALWHEMAEGAYPYLFAGEIDIKTATTSQIEEEFKKHGASGDTVRKCLAFFLSAAKQADIKISPHIKPSSRPRNGGRVRKNIGALIEQPIAPPAPPPGTGTAKVIQLQRGGTLTLSLDVNILDMDETDRKFVFELIDKIKTYETGSKKSEETEPASE